MCLHERVTYCMCGHIYDAGVCFFLKQHIGLFTRICYGRWSKICKLRSIVQKIISEPNSYFRPCGTLKWQPPIPQWCHKYAIAGKKFNSFNLCILTFLDLVLITLDCMAIQKNSTNMRTNIINTVWTKQIRRQTHTHWIWRGKIIGKVKK